MSEKAASERFLDAFNAIDRLLRRRFDVGRSASFHSVVTTAAQSDAAVDAYAIDLRKLEFGQLERVRRSHIRT